MSDHLASLPEVSSMVAHTEANNLQSQKVLIKNGFSNVPSETDQIRFERISTT